MMRRMDEWLWETRGAAFLRSVQEATNELQRNALSIKNDPILSRDVLDPTSDSLKKCFDPLYDSLWDYCRPGVNPKFRERIFGVEPDKDEISAYRIWNARYRKIKDHVRAIEEYCRAGQERFPIAAAEYEFIRLEVIGKCESAPESLSEKYYEQINGIRNALKKISILTIGDVIKVAKGAVSHETVAGKHTKRKHYKCTSRFAGRMIRNLSIADDGNTFTVCREYTYKITAKQAIEFLDKLIESYEKTNQPVKAEFQVAAVFKRGDAMRFKKRFMVCKNGFVYLNIPR